MHSDRKWWHGAKFGLATKQQCNSPQLKVKSRISSKNWTLQNSQIHTKWAGLSICTKQKVKNGIWILNYVKNANEFQNSFLESVPVNTSEGSLKSWDLKHLIPTTHSFLLLFTISTFYRHPPWWKNVKSSKLSTHQRQIAGLTFAACVMNVCCVCASDLLVQPPMLPQYS